MIDEYTSPTKRLLLFHQNTTSGERDTHRDRRAGQGSAKVTACARPGSGLLAVVRVIKNGTTLPDNIVCELR